MTAKNLTTADVLRKARGYVEKGWCRNSNALDAAGVEVSPECRAAVRWCMWGAMRRAADWQRTGDAPLDAAMRTLAAATGGDPRRSVSAWNDAPRRTQAQVLRVFDKAIKLAEEEATR